MPTFAFSQAEKMLWLETVTPCIFVFGFAIWYNILLFVSNISRDGKNGFESYLLSFFCLHFQFDCSVPSQSKVSIKSWYYQLKQIHWHSGLNYVKYRVNISVGAISVVLLKSPIWMTMSFMEPSLTWSLKIWTISSMQTIALHQPLNGSFLQS